MLLIMFCFVVKIVLSVERENQTEEEDAGD